jgi:hypothetical protein
MEHLMNRKNLALNSRFESIEDTLAVVMMGIDSRRLKRFEDMTPVIQRQPSGEWTVAWNTDLTPTEEMAREALEFVTEAAMAWQDAGVLGSKPPRIDPRLLYATRNYEIIRNEPRTNAN